VLCRAAPHTASSLPIASVRPSGVPLIALAIFNTGGGGQQSYRYPAAADRRPVGR